MVIFLLLIVLAGCQEKKDPPARVLPTDDLEGTVHDFMEEYGNLIREGNFDSVPFLYDTLGAIIVGGDKKVFQPMDSLKARYGRYSKSKVYFKWDSMDVQMLDTSIRAGGLDLLLESKAFKGHAEILLHRCIDKTTREVEDQIRT